MHADILFNSVLVLLNSFLHFFRVKCPSSLWTEWHYNNPRLIIIVVVMSLYLLCELLVCRRHDGCCEA